MRFRFLITLGLILSLVLTSQAMASLRAAPDPAGAVVLCIGGAAVVVQVDEDGLPVAAPHFCPDCALHAAPLPDVIAPTAAPVSWSADSAVVSAVKTLSFHMRHLPPSRAPPFVV